MSSTKSTPAKPAVQTAEEKLQTVLGLATGTAQAEIAGATNKSVSAKATLETTVTEGDATDTNGVNAAVSLGITSSKEVKAAPAKKA